MHINAAWEMCVTKRRDGWVILKRKMFGMRIEMRDDL